MGGDFCFGCFGDDWFYSCTSLDVYVNNSMNDKKKVSLVLIKVSLLMGMVVLGFVIFAIYKETQQKKQKQLVIDALIEEKNRINRDNATMQEKLAYYSSSDYAEKKSRELNMQSPDEHLIVVKPSMIKKNIIEQLVNISSQEKKESLSNYQKWWNYLFKY
ncbi:MAG: hypothetical protein UT50_C0008G0010 [Candidatus Moranbacteria bacterium GW2011_GWA2_39_41]|nr:MAG: hypothetical protein UT50_C0008G0010 [Candidatus Moranbacteria bacterium GW2011_GWA2_39_41]